MPHMTDILERFHQVLVREIRDLRPEYLTEPFTVAEIYQDLVPYRPTGTRSASTSMGTMRTPCSVCCPEREGTFVSTRRPRFERYKRSFVVPIRTRRCSMNSLPPASGLIPSVFPLSETRAKRARLYWSLPSMQQRRARAMRTE